MDRKKKFKSRNNKPLSFNFDSIVKTQSPIVFRNGNFLVKFSMNKCVSSCFIDCACGICGKKFLGKAPRLSHIHFNHYEAIRKSNVSKLLKEEKGKIWFVIFYNYLLTIF